MYAVLSFIRFVYTVYQFVNVLWYLYFVQCESKKPTKTVGILQYFTSVILTKNSGKRFYNAIKLTILL